MCTRAHLHISIINAALHHLIPPFCLYIYISLILEGQHFLWQQMLRHAHPDTLPRDTSIMAAVSMSQNYLHNLKTRIPITHRVWHRTNAKFTIFCMFTHQKQILLTWCGKFCSPLWSKVVTPEIVLCHDEVYSRSFP